MMVVWPRIDTRPDQQGTRLINFLNSISCCLFEFIRASPSEAVKHSLLFPFALFLKCMLNCLYRCRSIYRSRSVTPSSFSGTPPQTMHATDVAFPSSISTSGLLPSPNSAMAGGRHEFQARNYSDIMRSLAAKYHNNNNNSPGINVSNE